MIYRLRYRLLINQAVKQYSKLITLCSLLLLIIIGAALLYLAWPIMKEKNFTELLLSSRWKPFKGEFGFYTYIVSTVYVTFIALVIALPVSLLTGIYLSEYANARMRKFFSPVIDLLAGIPPVIYGVWGTLTIVPLVADMAEHHGKFSTGYSVLAGGVVLSIMIIPLIIGLLVEMLRSVPAEMREASWSLGATRWETIRKVLLVHSLPGIFAITVLALTRAFGETIAVLMVCGNMTDLPQSIFDSCYPLPALIANNYGEMMSLPSYESALMFAALLLFVLMLLLNSASRLVLYHLNKKYNQ